MLFTWSTTGCDTIVFVLQFCGNTVSGTIAAIRQLRVPEQNNAFEAALCEDSEGEDDMARSRSPEVDEAT